MGGLETDEKQFCQTCSLIYKQSKTEHNKTENHKMIRRFLMPRCDTCKMDFKSPMSDEKHLADYSHILKRQSAKKESTDKIATETKNEDIDSHGEGGIYMDNLDEVGDVEIPKDGEDEKEMKNNEDEDRKNRKE